MNEDYETTESSRRQIIKGRLRSIEGATLKHAHRFIIRRWKNLQDVRRHAMGWLCVVLILTGLVVWQSFQTTKFYSQPIPSEGVTYTEGIVGAVDNLNPIFASTPAERAASRLLFANLLTYDEKGDLVGELAQNWTVDESEKVYTLTLRSNARWHDGTPITSKDVVYTLSTIKDADTRSPLYSSWRNIAVEAVNERTIRFTLPTPYAPFPNALVLGILPQHKLNGLRPAELRNNMYNRSPTVASGAFTFQDMRSLDTSRSHQLIRLAANPDYFLGAPKLSRFQLHAYADREQLLSAYRSQEVSAISDASTQQLQTLEEQADTEVSESPLFNGVYAFLKTSSPILQDTKVRQALQLATDRSQLVSRLHNRVQPLASPLLPGQLGYRSDLQEPAPNITLAKQLLDEAGWQLGADGKRHKGEQELKLQLVTVSGGDYPRVAQEVMDQWSTLGVSFNSQLMKADDLQQNTIVPRAYDILIYELAIGRDPDVFAYWHSSQATERGFNLSDYKSPRADDLLDSARGRRDPALREAKYRSFIQQWLTDVPAIGLYRPALSYVQTSNVTSFTPRPLIDPLGRYFNIRYWSSTKTEGRPTL
jgi:peptide/nickel transport system substrate-binding protein